MKRRRVKNIGLTDVFKVWSMKKFYLDILILTLVCIPFVMGVLYFSLLLDEELGFNKFVSYPFNIILFWGFSIIGFIIIWYSYTYLVIVGQGSPSPHLGGTNKLVTSGPYSKVRHPSVTITSLFINTTKSPFACFIPL